MENIAAVLKDLWDQIVSTVIALGINPASVWFYIQLGLIVFAFLLGKLIQGYFNKRFDINERFMGLPWALRRFLRILAQNVWLTIFIVLIISSRAVLLAYTWPSRSYLLFVAVQLAIAWLFIHLIAAVIRNAVAYRVAVISAWTIAALSILNLLERTTAALNSFGVQLGQVNITPLLIVKLAIFLSLALWLVFSFVRLLELRLTQAQGLTPSIRVLIGQLVKVTLVVLAVTAVLSSAGIDLSAFALFSGALGVGIGCGLQKIVSNFVSGLILLLDKSIKPGDVISVGESFGWVAQMGARYTSIVTREGREFLIPNEEFITQKVVNWSFSNNHVRLETRFGVSYASNPHRVREVAVAAVSALNRILKEPAPQCYIVGFGDSSLDFVMRFWIDNPSDGLSNIRGEVFLALWDAFQREGIEIPFPVRDIRLPADFGKPPGAAK